MKRWTRWGWAGAALGGLLFALLALRPRYKWIETKPRERDIAQGRLTWRPSDIYPVEGHECTLAEWEQPAAPAGGR